MRLSYPTILATWSQKCLIFSLVAIHYTMCDVIFCGLASYVISDWIWEQPLQQQDTLNLLYRMVSVHIS